MAGTTSGTKSRAKSGRPSPVKRAAGTPAKPKKAARKVSRAKPGASIKRSRQAEPKVKPGKSGKPSKTARAPAAGGPRKTGKTGKKKGVDLKKLRAALIKRRQELLHLVEVSEESRQTVELDQTTVGRLSRMDALQSQAIALETGRRRDVELRRIDAALKRIDEGEFGYCAVCGERIEPKRLEYDPTVPVCLSCAELYGKGRST